VQQALVKSSNEPEFSLPAVVDHSHLVQQAEDILASELEDKFSDEVPERWLPVRHQCPGDTSSAGPNVAARKPNSGCSDTEWRLQSSAISCQALAWYQRIPNAIPQGQQRR